MILADKDNITNLLNSDSTKLLYFGAPWCAPCKVLKPILNTLELKHTSIGFLEINVDVSPELANKFNVRSVPQLLIYKNKAVTDGLSGSQQERTIIEMLHRNA